MPENRVSRKNVGPKRDEVIRDWRKLHSEKLHDLCSSPNIIRVITSRRMRCAGHVARMGRGEGVLVVRSEGKKPLGRPSRRREDNIKMNLQEVEWGHGLNTSGSRLGQVADTFKCGNEHSICIKCGEVFD